MIAVSNLDFEFELADGPNYRTRRASLLLGSRWQHILRLLPEARRSHCLDPTVLQDTNRSVNISGSRLVMWGVTPRIIALAERLGLAQKFPDPDVVRQGNDKLTSHRLEIELGLQLPYSRVVTSIDQWRQAVECCPHNWVLKHPLGFSALERAVGKRGMISDSAMGWATGRFEAGWSLLFEPWVDKTTELSMHFHLSPNGESRFLGHCQLLTDLSGVYRGNRVLPDPLNPTLLNHGFQVVEKLARLGYWGLVGIDAMIGHLAQQPVLRPVMEINARCSFGRLALALGDFVPDGWSYLWWHPSRKDSQHLTELKLTPLDQCSEELAPGAYALPAVADPQSQSGTLVLVATSPAELSQLEKHWNIHPLTGGRTLDLAKS